VDFATFAAPLKQRDAVETETPAVLATARSVGVVQGGTTEFMRLFTMAKRRRQELYGVCATFAESPDGTPQVSRHKPEGAGCGQAVRPPKGSPRTPPMESPGSQRLQSKEVALGKHFIEMLSLYSSADFLTKCALRQMNTPQPRTSSTGETVLKRCVIPTQQSVQYPQI
jgi:hypothetical protein